ncbi:MAG: cupin domain-containing protein [Candidatus Thermoplasmatota archaeon]|nr:cupin domain-containing protein [Candidatus Thermoplasmatota archaeon]
MTIIIIEGPPKEMIPEKSIRADVAWQLFLPEHIGDIPAIGNERTEPIRHWLWWELSKRQGFMKEEKLSPAYIIAPPLTREGKEFLIRTSSLWANKVHLVEANGKNVGINSTGENLWIPPVVNVKEKPLAHSALSRLTEHGEGEEMDTHFSPILGAGKSYVRAYTIEKNGTYARFHSHTAREELYLVLNGKGTIRIGDHNVLIKEGDLVAKPTGPDISTQFLANMGETMRILDIEIWPEDEKTSKDAVLYPDHEELDLFGQGWHYTVPSVAIMDFLDSMSHYGTGYRRKADGSWEPKDIPGHKKREK